MYIIDRNLNKTFVSMKNKTFNGQSSQSSVATSAEEYRVIFREAGSTFPSANCITFTSKDRADQFISLMKAEGYEFLDLCGAYIG